MRRHASSLIEPVPAIEITCSGLDRVHVIGGGIGCFLLYRNDIPLIGSPTSERVLVGRVFAPLSAIPEAIEIMTVAAEHAALRTITDGARRLIS